MSLPPGTTDAMIDALCAPTCPRCGEDLSDHRHACDACGWDLEAEVLAAAELEHDARKEDR